MKRHSHEKNTHIDHTHHSDTAEHYSSNPHRAGLSSADRDGSTAGVWTKNPEPKRMGTGTRASSQHEVSSRTSGREVPFLRDRSASPLNEMWKYALSLHTKGRTGQ